MGSKYLLKPPRTLREACCEHRATHPEMSTRHCDECPHGALCAISEQIETDRRGRVVKIRTRSPRKVA